MSEYFDPATLPYLTRRMTFRERMRRSEQNASACLGKGAALKVPFTGLLLFCMIGFFFLVLFSVWTSFTAMLYQAVWAGIFCVVAFVLCAAPLLAGRMRVSGLLLTGREPGARELLYYYTSPSRFLRGLVLSLVHIVALLAPWIAAFVAAVCLIYLVANMMEKWTGLALFPLLLAGVCVGSVLLWLLLLVISSFFLFAMAIGTGNDNLSLEQTFLHAFHTGRKHVWVAVGYRLRSMIYILLSLFTLGVLYALYFAHRIQLTYLDLCMTIKGEENER